MLQLQGPQLLQMLEKSLRKSLPASLKVRGNLLEGRRARSSFRTGSKGNEEALSTCSVLRSLTGCPLPCLPGNCAVSVGPRRKGRFRRMPWPRGHASRARRYCGWGLLASLLCDDAKLSLAPLQLMFCNSGRFFFPKIGKANVYSYQTIKCLMKSYQLWFFFVINNRSNSVSVNPQGLALILNETEMSKAWSMPHRHLDHHMCHRDEECFVLQ